MSRQDPDAYLIFCFPDPDLVPEIRIGDPDPKEIFTDPRNCAHST
jgi:hypothetical protein